MTTRRPALPMPPAEYDSQYMVRLLSILQNYFATIDNPGEAVYASLRLLNLPTNPQGLPDGQLWTNGTGGVFIVEPRRAYPTGVQATYTAGNV